jgi:hypothetical protein
MWYLQSEIKVKNRSNAYVEIIIAGIICHRVQSSWNPFTRKRIVSTEKIILGSRQPFLKNATKSYPFHKVDQVEVQIFCTGFKDLTVIFMKCGTWEITDETFSPIDSTQMSHLPVTTIQTPCLTVTSIQMLLAENKFNMLIIVIFMVMLFNIKLDSRIQYN